MEIKIDLSDIATAKEEAEILKRTLEDIVNLAKMANTLLSEQNTKPLSVVEAAKALGISRATIYREIERGKIKALTVGENSKRIEPIELERYKRNAV